MSRYEIVNGEALDNALTSIADSIRAKTGSTEKFSSPQAMKEAVESISGGTNTGDSDVLESIIEGTAVELDIGGVEVIRKCAFAYLDSLIKIRVDNAVDINASAFTNCENLAVAEFPLVTYVDMSAFANCKNLHTVVFGDLSTDYSLYLRDYAFENCPKLSTLIIRNPNMVAKMQSTHAFEYTPFIYPNGGTRTIVPRDMISAYLTEVSTWQNMQNNAATTFLPLEDYTVDGTITGAIDWDKLNGTTENT